MEIGIRGYALDNHTISSTPCGLDEYGHQKFETLYTPIGDLLHKCKYKGDKEAVIQIANECLRLVPKIRNADVIIPVPPTKLNRELQPVIAIARRISLITSVKLLDGIFQVQPHNELKGIADSNERIRILKENIQLRLTPDLKNKNVLIFDDLYRSGSTLRVLCNLLKQFEPKHIWVLTVTKTRSNK